MNQVFFNCIEIYFQANPNANVNENSKENTDKTSATPMDDNLSSDHQKESAAPESLPPTTVEITHYDPNILGEYLHDSELKTIIFSN